MKFIFVFLFSFVFSFKLLAQGSASGCLISSSNTVYQTQESPIINAILQLLLGGNPSYVATSGKPLSPNYCSWTPLPSGPTNCGVCTAYIIEVELFIPVVKGCQTGKLLQGHIGNYTMVQCPLDDYAFPLTATAGVLGLFFIRRKLR